MQVDRADGFWNFWCLAVNIIWSATVEIIRRYAFSSAGCVFTAASHSSCKYRRCACYY